MIMESAWRVINIRKYMCTTFTLIVLGFNDISTLVGHFVLFPEKGRKQIEEKVERMKERDREERGK